jgi:hypothetical protein
VYFTIQPGAAYVAPKGAWVVYPNYTNLDPGTRVSFWNYDPEERGWHIYGQGTVTPDGRQVVPDKNTRLYAFTGAMFGGNALPPDEAPAPGDDDDGDPVSLGTGLFVLSKTDLVLPDVMPLTVTRTYRPNDTVSRAFGRGTNWNFGIYLSSADPYQESTILPMAEGHHVRVAWHGLVRRRVPLGLDADPVLQPVVRWNGNGWDLEPAMVRPTCSWTTPLRGHPRPNGNSITIERQNATRRGRSCVSARPTDAGSRSHDASNRIHRRPTTG